MVNWDKTIAVKCYYCDDYTLIPTDFNQTWYVCWDCGLFKEAERLENERKQNEQYS
jgi:hypothetical protein